MNFARRTRWMVTALATLAVALALHHRGGEDSATGSSLLFPGLAATVNEVAHVRLEDAGDSFVLDYAEGVWRVADGIGYAADTARLRGLVLALAEAEIVEPKTARPERYGEIGVAGLDADGSRARRVVLLNAEGVALASLLVGDARGADTTYVRKSGDARSFLVRPRIEAGGTAADWRDRKIVGVERSLIERVSIRHEEGATVTVVADGKGAFQMEDIPSGARVKYQYQVNDVATSWTGMEFTDVRPASTEAAGGGSIASLVTRDGVWVDVEETSPASGWYRFRARVRDDVDAPDSEAPARVEQWTRRWSGWEYALPAGVQERLFRAPEELLDAPVDADPGAGPDPGIDSTGS